MERQGTYVLGQQRSTLAYIRWGIQLECARGRGEGDKVVGTQ